MVYERRWNPIKKYRNERKNEISIFGMDRQDEYILRKDSSEGQKVELFINHEYLGIYSLNHRVERRMIEDEELQW